MDSKKNLTFKSDDQAENIATVGQAISYIEEAI
jgi:acyl carrier protein